MLDDLTKKWILDQKNAFLGPKIRFLYDLPTFSPQTDQPQWDHHFPMSFWFSGRWLFGGPFSANDCSKYAPFVAKKLRRPPYNWVEHKTLPCLFLPKTGNPLKNIKECWYLFLLMTKNPLKNIKKGVGACFCLEPYSIKWYLLVIHYITCYFLFIDNNIAT